LLLAGLSGGVRILVLMGGEVGLPHLLREVAVFDDHSREVLRTGRKNKAITAKQSKGKNKYQPAEDRRHTRAGGSLRLKGSIPHCLLSGSFPWEMWFTRPATPSRESWTLEVRVGSSRPLM
jgi:hypothetical protein